MGAKYNFLNLIGHLQGLSSHILAYYLFNIPWNMYTWSSSYKTLERNVIFRPLFGSRDENKKFKNLIAHLQDIPNHILEYHLSTIWNVDGFQLTSLVLQKTSLFDPQMIQGEMKIPNPYCTSAIFIVRRIGNNSAM